MKVKMSKVFPTLIKKYLSLFYDLISEKCFFKAINNSMENGDTRNSVIFNNKLLLLQNRVSAIPPPHPPHPPTHTHTHTSRT
jgi:hypothetical protein